MKGLAQRLDALTLPSIPKAFNDVEATQILSILRNAQARVRPYDGDYRAPWLLSAFDSPVWHTTNRGREEHIQGHWRNTIDIDWNQLLPNGAWLVDPEYALLLSTLKKMCVLLRSGYVGRGLAPGNWRLATAQLLLVARWLVLHEARYQPARHAFALLDQNALNLLLSQISRGSWIEALQIPQRLLSAWYARAFGEPCPQTFLDNPYTLPSEVCGTLTLWLTSQSCYVTRRGGVHHGLHNLDRVRLALQVNTSTVFLMASNWVRVFCRQFEPDFRHSPLLLSTCMYTEYPDQTTRARQDTARSTASFGTLEQVAVTLGRILGAHRHLADAIPSPGELSVKKAFDLAKAHTRSAGHHPFIPIATGLAYLNEAMRWVHSYGEAIVDYYLATISHLDFSTVNTLSKQVKRDAVRKAFASVQRTAFLVEHHGRTQPLADALGIQTFNRGNGKAKFEALRQAPTLVEALDVLIGACIICIALLKPSREAELTHLTRECLTRRHDGYYLRFDLGKSNAGEAYQTRDKPIPVITAQAIRLLQRLGETLSKAFGETRKRKDSLFYLPCACLGIAINPNPKMLSNSLDRFCDYVGLPPDTEGRRWYVRVHEMRKWFLLLLFWAGRFDVLDAVRWIAGHVDVAHTYAYIEEQFPGEELPGIEAEYSIDRLRRWDRAKRETDSAACPADEPGLDALYDRVRRHFNAASLVMIPEPQWTDYVTALRAEGGFSLYPQSIYGEDGEHKVGLQVSFVLAQNTA
jgi:hypothetical protein